MKKVLAFILSLVLVLGVVVLVACDSQPGGNNFKTLDLNDDDTRTEFVNVLAEKVDSEKLFGDSEQDGWKFGLSENGSSKLGLDLALTPAEGADKLTVKGNVEFKQSAKLTLKKTEDGISFANSLNATAKGNVDLSENIYALLGEETAAIVKKIITNFNYTVDTYMDEEVALISLSDSLYKNLPEKYKEALGSRKIKIALKSSSIQTFAEETDGEIDNELEYKKEFINGLIDSYLIPLKISVSVANTNGYAIKFTVTKESVLAVLSSFLPSETEGSDSWIVAAINSVASSISDDAKFELIVRIGQDGSFSAFSLTLNCKLTLDFDIPDYGKVTGTVSVNSSVETKKFSGSISKPNEKDYTEFKGFSSGDNGDIIFGGSAD